jgi:hypothetical protein
MEQNNYLFELEILTDKRKMKRILQWIGIFFTAAWATHFIGLANRDINCVHIAAVTVSDHGWPLTLYWWGLIIGTITPVCFLLTYFILTKKSPSLALNNEGLFVNQQFISKMLVPWSDISRIEEERQGKVSVLNVYFKNPQQIIARQTFFSQLFLKGKLNHGEALKCDNRLVTGDFSAFFERAQFFLNRATGQE